MDHFLSMGGSYEDSSHRQVHMITNQAPYKDEALRIGPHQMESKERSGDCRSVGVGPLQSGFPW